jgi:hypothetical protein
MVVLLFSGGDGDGKYTSALVDTRLFSYGLVNGVCESKGFRCEGRLK